MKHFQRNSVRGAFLFGALAACLQIGYSQIDNRELATLIAQMQGDDYEARYEARMEIQDYVTEAGAPGNEEERAEAEAQLLALVEGDFPVTTRLWLLRQLGYIGSVESVDVLKEIMDHENTRIADAARMALVSIPDESALRALIDRLESVEDEAEETRLLNGLLQRGDATALEAVVAHLQDANAKAAELAAMGVQRLDAESAREKIAEAYGLAPERTKTATEIAMIAATNDFSVCEELVANGSTVAIKAAAFRKCIDMNVGKASRILEAALEDGADDSDRALLRIAFQSGRGRLKNTALKRVDSMEPGLQTVALGALAAEGRSRRSERIALELANSSNETVRLLAIEALGRVGGFASLDTLLEAMDDRSRDLSEAAGYSLALVEGRRIDRKLISAARKGEQEDRVAAIRALGYRNSKGAAELVNELALKRDESEEVREAALEAMEQIGDEESLFALAELIVSEPKSGGLRRDAQQAIKRAALRIGDPSTAWDAFASGFEKAGGDTEAREALLAVIDSVPSEEAIEYIRDVWPELSEAARSSVGRSLGAWQNWDGGFLLLDLAMRDDTSADLKAALYRSISRLILSSDRNYTIEGKMELAEKALTNASDDSQKRSILSAFRNADSRDKNFLKDNEVPPELEEAIKNEGA